MSPRVLIVCPQVFPTPHSGVGMRGHFQAMHLSRRWPGTLLTETGIYEVENGVFKLRCGKQTPQASNGAAYLRSLLHKSHYLFEKYNCRRWLVPNRRDYTHIIIHYPALLPLASGRRGTESKVILDTHNNEREYYESVADQAHGRVKRSVIRAQATVSERIVRQCGREIDATVSVSQGDRDWVAGLCGPQVKHFVVPNNLFTYDPTRWTGRRTILYVGSLNVNMNLQALEWFTENVWPRLRQLHPDVEFVVAGRNPAALLIEHLQGQGIKVVPNAPSLRRLYADALCSVIPASSGSGGKIKVGEALAHGVPVLTTPSGLVGQPAPIKGCCIVRDEPGSWVDVIGQLLSGTQRTSREWDAKVRAVLQETSFSSSLEQVAQYIEQS